MNTALKAPRPGQTDSDLQPGKLPGKENHSDHACGQRESQLHLIKASLPANIRIHREIADNIGYILANPTEIHQILMNLCAMRFMRWKKSVILKVCLANTAIRDEGSSERHYVCV